MKRLFTFIVGAAFSLGALAQDFDSGGLNYSVLSSDDKTCTVTGFNDLPSDLVIPETVEYDGVEYTVTEIASMAFQGRDEFQSLSLPSTLEVIGSDAFWYCNGFTEVVIPNSVKVLENYCFGECNNLKRVVLGSSVESIGYGAFTSCDELNSVYPTGDVPAQFVYGFSNAFPSNPLVAVSEDLIAAYQTAWDGANVVPNIDAEDIYFDPREYTVTPGGTVQLNCVTVPANAPFRYVNIYPQYITVDNNGLVTADPLKGNVHIGVVATTLNGLSVECSLYIDPIPEFTVDGFVYVVTPNTENEVSIIRYESDATVVNIPETVEYDGSIYSVTTIGPNVFNWNETVEEVEIPASVSLIRESNFNYCQSLKKVTIDGSSTPIELNNYVFTDCRNLTEVYVGRNVTYTGDGICFRWNEKLSQIILGELVTELPDYIFRECSNLSLVQSQNPVPPTLGEEVFSWNSFTIIVPAESVDAYKEAWSQYSDYISEAVDATDLSVASEEITLYNGQRVKLDYTVEPADATVSFYSSNPNIVSIDAEGYINYDSWRDQTGEAIITVSTLNGLTAECKVTAKHWLTFSENEVSLTPGSTYQVEVSKAEAIADETLTWWSDNENVATVDENGLITAVAYGSTRINASVNVPDMGDFGYSIEVEVAAEPTSVTADKSEISVFPDYETDINLTFEPQDVPNLNREMTWTVANPEIAEVNVNNWGTSVRGLNPGKTTITGTTVNGLTVDIEVTVKARIEDIIFITESMFLGVGQSKQFEFTTVPAETYQAFEYTSSNDDVATVDENGVVTGVAVGNASIGIRYETPWGTETYWRWMPVEVVTVPESISIAGSSDLEGQINHETDIPLEVTPEGACMYVEWTADDPEIVEFYSYKNWWDDSWTNRFAGKKFGTTAFHGVALNGEVLEGTITIAGMQITEDGEPIETKNVEVGEEFQISVNVSSDDLLANLYYESGDTRVATVTQNESGCTVTAVGYGKTWIHVYSSVENQREWYQASFEVRVSPKEGMVINPNQLVLSPINWISYPDLLAAPDVELGDVNWTSSDQSVVEIGWGSSSQAELRYVGPGSATVTATASDGSSATCEVICVNPSLNETNIVMGLEQTRQLEILGLPEDVDVYINWWSDDSNIVYVTDGLITSQNYGSARIYAWINTTEGNRIGQLEAYVEVIDLTYVTDIALDPSKIQIEDNMIGKTVQIRATVMPEDATDKTLYWSSSDESVVTVDQNGVVSILKRGNAVVTASAIDGSGVTATCVISPAAPPVAAESMALSPEEWEGEIGESIKLKAVFTPSYTSDQRVNWASSNESVATVDRYGRVTAIAVGNAVITATYTKDSSITAECKVTVKEVLVKSISITPESWTGEIGESFSIKATVLPENAANKTLKFESSDPKVATVDSNGQVKVLSEGTCVITVSTTDGSDLKAECQVTVNPPAPILAESLTITPEEWSGEEGESFRIEATVLPEDTADKTLSYVSSNPSVATVDDEGLVTLVSQGTCVITVSTTDGSGLSAECHITGVSGIEAIFSGSHANIDVYTQQGILIKHNCTVEDLEMLQSGIYIIRRGEIVKTVFLRK